MFSVLILILVITGNACFPLVEQEENQAHILSVCSTAKSFSMHCTTEPWLDNQQVTGCSRAVISVSNGEYCMPLLSPLYNQHVA